MRQTAKTFKPTQDQINAAKLVFAAMAITQTIRPIVEGYQRAILDVHWSRFVVPNVGGNGRA